MSNKHIGSSLDAFLREEGILDDVQARAIKEVEVWQLTQISLADALAMPVDTEIEFDPPCSRDLPRPVDLD